MKTFIRNFVLGLILVVALDAGANPWNGKVVLQGFWWDYYNNNYPNNWSTYLADLAPRLRDLGIDGVWIPPTLKNKNATGSVGYSPFDHYDLGDKYQCGSVATRFGTKDQYLRSVAVLHANGIDVIQDMVWNHMDGAGTETGAGGLDPAAPSNQYKNFRYVCYASYATNTSAANYGARRGRFYKNWQNFHPNPDHNTESGDIAAGFFGPDICYYNGAYGLSSNCSYNPAESPDYMRNGIRDWSVWLKKQTGVDGFRLDAVKHFETWAAKDFVWNLAYNAGFASGGSQMYAVGEFIGSAGEIDGWVDGVNNSDGFTDVVGSFDVSLRGAIKNMVSSSGAFDLGSIPGSQQARRNRTAPYVNSHDTFRPRLDSNGNYVGWDSANELGGHIEPVDPRIQAAYAIAMAVDGSPTIFFEDLFDVGTTGRRWTHDPTKPAELPVRDWLVNLIWCHQKLNFKDGAYRVRWQAPELLIIERSGRAVIGVNDQWNTWQSGTIQTDFGANVRLHDYSGANQDDIWTDGSGRATIFVPPCDGSNVRRGYTVWGPAGIGGGFSPANRGTTQEWEMADDLGDSHPTSLGQGGALPQGSTALRTAGKIFPGAGLPLTVNLYPTLTNNSVTVTIYNAANAPVTNATGFGVLALTYSPTNAEFHSIRVQNTYSTNASQRIYVKVAYAAPQNLRAMAPYIVVEPRDQATVAGRTVALTVQGSGFPQVAYQWQFNGADIPGGTFASYTIGAAQLTNSGTYSVRLNNSAGQAMSRSAQLTVYDSAQPGIAGIGFGPGNAFQFSVLQKAGLPYLVEASTNLISWTSLRSGTAPFAFSDALSTNYPARFYRILFQ